jgi:hypothetical protein
MGGRSDHCREGVPPSRSSHDRPRVPYRPGIPKGRQPARIEGHRSASRRGWERRPRYYNGGPLAKRGGPTILRGRCTRSIRASRSRSTSSSRPSCARRSLAVATGRASAFPPSTGCAPTMASAVRPSTVRSRSAERVASARRALLTQATWDAALPEASHPRTARPVSRHWFAWPGAVVGATELEAVAARARAA